MYVFSLIRCVETFIIETLCLQSMLHFDPLKRINTRDILKHEYFKNLDNASLPAGDWRGDLQLVQFYENAPPLNRGAGIQ